MTETQRGTTSLAIKSDYDEERMSLLETGEVTNNTSFAPYQTTKNIERGRHLSFTFQNDKMSVLKQ
jgi:hypothetical protein